jgi:hypothetical protein
MDFSRHCAIDDDIVIHTDWPDDLLMHYSALVYSISDGIGQLEQDHRQIWSSITPTVRYHGSSQRRHSMAG